MLLVRLFMRSNSLNKGRPGYLVARPSLVQPGERMRKRQHRIINLSHVHGCLP